MIKKISFFLVLLMSISLFSQNINLDKYQYIVVADKFDFLKTSDQYQTSSLTKFLFQKIGFQVFISNEEMPQELKGNQCLALFASVKDESSMFTIKNLIEIKDCYGKTVYTSKVGKSKLKDYKRGYQEAIRNAFDSMEDDFVYSYNPDLAITKKEVEDDVIIAKSFSDDVVTSVKKIPKEVQITGVKKDVEKKEAAKFTAIDVLYAQSIKNGFQLVNTKPEVVFLLLKTNKEDVFIIKGKNGTFFKNGENWIAEYYENDQLVKKEYQVKF